MTNDPATTRKTVEVFTAGCPLCDDAVETARSLAGDAADVHALDTHDPQVARRARDLGVRTVPAVVVDGEIAACCTAPGISEDTIREHLDRPTSDATDVKAGTDEPGTPSCC